jgi:hypothetical protein
MCAELAEHERFLLPSYLDKFRASLHNLNASLQKNIKRWNNTRSNKSLTFILQQFNRATKAGVPSAKTIYHDLAERLQESKMKMDKADFRMPGRNF